MNLEWHYPRENPTDLPKEGSTVLIAEFIPASTYQGVYDHERYRVTMYEKFDPKILSWWTKHFTYAWAYFEIPPLKKGE